MKYDLFISYSRHDFDEVNALVIKLQECIPMLKIWFDITGIESGEEFEDKIVSAIDNSSFVLFALSANSMKSQWAKDEVMYAKNTGKRVIPVLLRGATISDGWFLFKFGRVDCIDSTKPIQFEKLCKDLYKWVGQGKADYKSHINVVEEKAFKHIDPKVDSNNEHREMKGLKFTKWKNSIAYSDMKKRHPLVNSVIFLLLIASGIFAVFSFSEILWSFSLFDDPEWTFLEVYGKGMIPGTLIAIIVFVGMLDVFNMRQSGFWLISLISLLLVIPTTFNEYEEVLWFAIPLLLSLVLFYCLLKIKKDGRTAWDTMIPASSSFRKTAIYSWIVFVVLIISIPVFMSIGFGFRSNLYSNGMLIFNAKWSTSPSYYCNDLANKMANNEDGLEYVYTGTVESWYERAIEKAGKYGENCYFDYADFLIKNDDYERAKIILQKANDRYNNKRTKEKLESLTY